MAGDPTILVGGVIYLLGGIFLLLLLYVLWQATSRLRTPTRVILTVVAGLAGFTGLGLLVSLWPQVQQAVGDVSAELARRLSIPIATIGSSEITLWSIIKVVLYLGFLGGLAHLFRRFLLQRVLSKTNVDIALQRAIAAGAGYVVAALGLLVGLQAAGFDLSVLAVAAGTLGIGAGFGLQGVAANLAAGLTILFERPFRIGDRIELDGINGQVISIGMRSTTVLTNDYVAIIVPNANLVNSNVVNWSYGQKIRRFGVPVGVAYESDPKQVERVLLGVAERDENVMKQPAPWVRFKEFGDSAFEMELMVFTSSLLDKPRRFVSNLNYAIVDAFREEGIQIPFPQRDVHLFPERTLHTQGGES